MKKITIIFAALILLLNVSLKAQYKLEWVFTNLPSFSNPIEMVHADDGTNRLFVAQQRGLIYVFNNNPTVTTRKTFIDLSSKVSQSGIETGLLGLAFHPEYESTRHFYVNYTFDSAAAFWSRIARYTADLSNPDTALINTELILLTLSKPFSSHNGGKVAFGSDGYLYIAFGDGGSSGDPFGNGQNKSVLLGKILRINVDSAGGGRSYSIPVTNPFYGNTQGYKEEIYAYGLRNPWKFSFDYPTNRIYAGDVGQNLYEEIDIIENGKNYGWNKMEGFHCYGTCDTTGMGFTRPIWEYIHPGFASRSVTGGYVYRGNLLPGLYSKYVYADYETGEIWALTYDGINPTTNTLLLDSTFLVSSFGVDQNNELYVVRYSGATGRIYRIANTAVITLNLRAAVQGFYDLGTGKLNMKDTLKVYLRQTTSPYTMVDSTKTIIDSNSFNGLCLFSLAPNGSYYIVEKHRNSIETWSKLPGTTLTKGIVNNYDFTTDSVQAFGNNLIQKGGVFCFYSGDINQDGVIDGTDNSAIDNDASVFALGFRVTDLDADGVVDGSDLLIADNNSANFVVVMRP